MRRPVCVKCGISRVAFAGPPASHPKMYLLFDTVVICSRCADSGRWTDGTRSLTIAGLDASALKDLRP